jgi:hypothetical protein
VSITCVSIQSSCEEKENVSVVYDVRLETRFARDSVFH